MKNYIHLEPRIKRKDRRYNKLMPGDQVVVTIVAETHSCSDYVEIEIEPLDIITEEQRTLTIW